MRRIQRIRQPAVVLTQCLHSTNPTILCRATAGASSCLVSRPRDFSTTPSRALNASRAWAAEKEKAPELVPESQASEAAPETVDKAPAVPASADPITETLNSEALPASEALPETATEAQQTQATSASTDPITETLDSEALPASEALPETPAESQSPQAEAESADPFADILAADLDPVNHVEEIAEVPITPQHIDAKFRLPPQERETAPRAEDIPPEDNYVPALTADALPVLGGLKNWFKPPPLASKKTADRDKPQPADNFGETQRYEPFALPQGKAVRDPVVMQLCVHRATVEAVVARDFGRTSLLTASWGSSDKSWDRALGVVGEVDGSGNAMLLGNLQSVADGLQNDEFKHGSRLKGSAEARKILENLSWDVKKVSLQDAALKFAIAKRVFQLTGKAIPDAKLLKVEKVGDLLDQLVEPPAPRTVHQAVERRGELRKLPNVAVFEKRQTPVDAAKRLGSWKVMVQELRKRGLPTVGRDLAAPDRSREAEWYKGPQPEVKDRKSGRRKH